MPTIKNSYKKTYPTKSRLSKKPSLRFFLSLIGLTLLAIALPVAYILVNQRQDIRQQAYDTTPTETGTGSGGSGGSGGGGGSACVEEHVNTQFRMYEEGTDKPWTDGDKMVVKVGDKIDLNCFAKTGSALLSNGKITLKVDGVVTTIPTASVINDGRTLKAYEITKGGVHAFTCANTASCSNTDSVSVPKVAEVAECTTDAQCKTDETCYQPPMPECPADMACAQVMPAKICKPKGASSCPNQSAADINKDCVVDLKDYDLFLSEFIKGL